MTDLLIKLLNHLNTYHLGMAKAIKREKLLMYLQGIGYTDLDDRELRRTVKKLKLVCCGPEGYFVPVNKEECDYSINYLKKKIFPLWEDIVNIRKSYPQYYHGEQLELFDVK